MNPLRLSLSAAALILAVAPPVVAQTGPLAAFGDLVVGTWEGDGSRHVFEWGVGELVVKTRSYFGDGSEWTLVSEGIWYADPDGDRIRGVTVAVEMPASLFEYTSRVGGDEVVHDLVTHGQMGGSYVERWSFSGNGYTWALEQGGERLMGGAYTKVD